MNIHVDLEKAGHSSLPGSQQMSFRESNPVFIYKFMLFNLAGFVLTAAAWMQGWVQTILFSDETMITLVITGTFLLGLSYCALKFRQLNGEMKCFFQKGSCKKTWTKDYLRSVYKRHSGSRAITGSALRLKMAGWIAPVRHFANSLVLLGLIGTVVGFIIALSGVDKETISDVSALSGTVSTLLSGMSVALYTTLVGAILNLWLMVNYHMLSTAAQDFIVKLIAMGEENARA